MPYASARLLSFGEISPPTAAIMIGGSRAATITVKLSGDPVGAANVDLQLLPGVIYALSVARLVSGPVIGL